MARLTMYERKMILLTKNHDSSDNPEETARHERIHDMLRRQIGPTGMEGYETDEEHEIIKKYRGRVSK